MLKNISLGGEDSSHLMIIAEDNEVTNSKKTKKDLTTNCII
jgi:hypothetical protein